LEAGETEKAMQDLLAAKEITPNDPRIDVEIARIGQSESSKTNSRQEMVIDLHGYSQENAKMYILYILASAQNTRKIRVITGRGNHPNQSGERGILYKEFHSWITESVYQHRIKKITSHDGYYEIYLHDSVPQQNRFFRQFPLDEIIKDINPIKILADQGDPKSQLLFADYLIANAKNDDNFKEVFEYYLRAAEQGNVKAMIEVATSYMMGRGTKQNDANAINWLNKAIEFDKFHAPLMLGDCYWGGHGVLKDPKQTFTFYNMAAEHNNPIAIRKVANCYGVGYGVDKDPYKAFELYKKAADMGDVMSQYNVAVMYQEGLGVVPDSNQAFNYFLKAANGGDPDAQAQIGFYYLEGKIVAADEEQANYWLTLASRNGCAQASAILSRSEGGDINLEALARSAQAGNICDMIEFKASQSGINRDDEAYTNLIEESYLKLRDMDRRDIIKLEHQSKFLLIDLLLMDDKKQYKRKALAVLEMMAEENCIFSLRRLAYAYHYGYGVQKNDRQAISYLEQASQFNDGKATGLLGYYNFTGDGVPRSIPRALEYFQRAAMLNDPVSNYELGLWYCNGGILTKNITQGIACLEKAIELENDPKILTHLGTGVCDEYTPIKKNAAFRLGIIYFLGDGTRPLDLDKGLGYFRYAKELGSKKAKAFLAKFDVMTNQGRTQELASTTTTANILQQLGGANKKPEPIVVTETPEQLTLSLEQSVDSSSEREHEQSVVNEPEVPESSSLFNYCSIL